MLIKVKRGIYATREASLAAISCPDVCYYAYRGKRFSFDPESDVNTSDLKRNIVAGYLRKYDPRFVNYFNRIWGGQMVEREQALIARVLDLFAQRFAKLR